MEDYYRIAFKYANILTDLQEILQTLESEEEKQEETQEEQEPPDPQPKSQCREDDLHETEEQRTLTTCHSHVSVSIPARGPYPSPRPHPWEEEQKSITQASSSQTMIRELDHHEDGVSEAGETTSNDVASNEEHDYAEIFQAMIAIPPDCN